MPFIVAEQGDGPYAPYANALAGERRIGRLEREPHLPVSAGASTSTTYRIQFFEPAASSGDRHKSTAAAGCKADAAREGSGRVMRSAARCAHQ